MVTTAMSTRGTEWENYVADLGTLRLGNVIGIAGRTCTGKSTLATCLTLHDPRYKIRPIAWEIARNLAAAFDMEPARLWEHRAKYQDLIRGVDEAARWIHGDGWFLYKVLRAASAEGLEHIIIPDIRLGTEVLMLQTMRGDGGMSPCGDTFMVRLLAADRVLRQRYYNEHGVPPNALEWAHETEVALLPEVLKMRREHIDFDHNIWTDAPSAQRVCEWTENMLEAGSFDFHSLSWLSLPEPRGGLEP